MRGLKVEPKAPVDTSLKKMCGWHMSKYRTMQDAPEQMWGPTMKSAINCGQRYTGSLSTFQSTFFCEPKIAQKNSLLKC